MSMKFGAESLLLDVSLSFVTHSYYLVRCNFVGTKNANVSSLTDIFLHLPFGRSLATLS